MTSHSILLQIDLSDFDSQEETLASYLAKAIATRPKSIQNQSEIQLNAVDKPMIAFKRREHMTVQSYIAGLTLIEPQSDIKANAYDSSKYETLAQAFWTVYLEKSINNAIGTLDEKTSRNPQAVEKVVQNVIDKISDPKNTEFRKKIEALESHIHLGELELIVLAEKEMEMFGQQVTIGSLGNRKIDVAFENYADAYYQMKVIFYNQILYNNPKSDMAGSPEHQQAFAQVRQAYLTHLSTARTTFHETLNRNIMGGFLSLVPYFSMFKRYIIAGFMIEQVIAVQVLVLFTIQLIAQGGSSPMNLHLGNEIGLFTVLTAFSILAFNLTYVLRSDLPNVLRSSKVFSTRRKVMLVAKSLLIFLGPILLGALGALAWVLVVKSVPADKLAKLSTQHLIVGNELVCYIMLMVGLIAYFIWTQFTTVLKYKHSKRRRLQIMTAVLMGYVALRLLLVSNFAVDQFPKLYQ